MGKTTKFIERWARRLVDMVAEIVRRVDRMHAPGPDQRVVLGSTLEPWLPLSEVFSNDEELIVRVVLPGVCKEDVDLRISGRRLFVSGIRREPFLRPQPQKWTYSSFKQVFELPGGFDVAEISAEFKGEVLEIRLHNGATAPSIQ